MKPRSRRAPRPGEAPREALLERVLLGAVLCGLMLLVTTPLVVTASTYYPFVVGKALYSRLVIEIVVAAWAVLAAIAPAYRPRRSIVLLLLAAGLAAAGVSAILGASPQRSFWSSYERMHGILDSAHWAALTLVGACVLRKREHWVALLHANLAVGFVVAGLALVQHFGVPDVPFYGDRLPVPMARPGSTLGNPIYLGAYAVLNAMLALGLLVHNCTSPLEGLPARGQRTPKRRRARPGRGAGRPPLRPPRLQRALPAGWLAACATVHLWAALLAGSRGPLFGAIFGMMALAVVCTFLARGRWRIAALSAVAALAVLGSAPLLIGNLAPPGVVKALDLPRAARRIVRIDLDHPTVQTRLTAWRAGIDGFADRPAFGWGPGNFMAPFARHGADWPKRMEPHDHAHSTFVEKLATEGAAGAALYLALWVATGIALARTARAARGRERVLALAVGAALAAHFAAMQTLFPTTVGSMHYALLLAFVASQEMRLRANATGPPIKPRPRGPWALSAGAVWCLAGAGAWANTAIWDGAAGAARASTAPLPKLRPYGQYDHAIRAFEPMATEIRQHAFERLAPGVARGAGRLDTTLGWLDAQTAAAVAAEPHNWRLRLAVAQIYAIAAEHDPSLLATAQSHAAALLEIAPGRRSVLSLYGTPGPVPRVRLTTVPDGVLVDWPPVRGALTYRLSLGHPDDRLALVHEGVATWAVIDPAPHDGRHIRLRACLGRANCGPWSDPVSLDDGTAPPERPAATASGAMERSDDRQP